MGARRGWTSAANQILPKAVQGEFDRYVPGGGGPTNLDVVAHSIVPNRHGNYSDVTWYTVDGGGGVFATGNASWVGQLANCPLIPSNVLPSDVPGVTDAAAAHDGERLLGPRCRPGVRFNASQGNWRPVYTPGSRSAAAPNISTSA